MESAELNRACIECCNNAYEYIEAKRFENPVMGMSVLEATYVVDGEEAVFKIQGKVPEGAGMMIRIDGREFRDTEVGFQEYNEATRTLRAFPSEYILNVLRTRESNRVQLIADLTWLIKVTGEFFGDFGDLVRYPDPPGSPAELILPAGMPSPTDQQRGAAESILREPLTYVWGAPGTGKTQMVLAISILSLLGAGKRIAILAPTNNAVEQVLRGVLNALRVADPGGDLIDTSSEVIRIGMSSDSFMKEFPEVCEHKDLRMKIRSKERTIEMCQEGIRSIRAGSHPVEFAGMDEKEIADRIESIRDEIEHLRGQDPDSRMRNARIIAMTPHKLMMSFGPRDAEGRKTLEVDHIFIDEAGYCNALNALPAFMFGVPVTMLGDHKQLPPVCEIDRMDIAEGIERDDSKRFFFLLDLSALYAEDLLSESRGQLGLSYIEGREQVHRRTVDLKLTQSHRFGDNLAAILDRFVYHNGITGSPSNRLEILRVDARCPRRDDRSNIGEAKAIKRFLENESPDPADVAILTPYRQQVALLKATVPRRYEDCVLTIHRSQGREWDTVIMSVSDDRTELDGKEFQLHLTSVKDGCGGASVINTAVSRAKRKLMIFCDTEFWLEKDGELLSGLLGDSEAVVVGRWR